METNGDEKYITFPVMPEVRQIMQQQPQQQYNIFASHEKICDSSENREIRNGLTTGVTSHNTDTEITEVLVPQVTQVAVEILTEKPDQSKNQVVYPIYIKQENQPQYTSAEDESMAVEALRQLGGMYPCFEDKKISCSNCNNIFTEAQMHKHKRLCIPKKLICTTCNETFEREIDLNNHMVCHQVDRPHACRTCGNLFRSKLNLQTHMAQAHQSGKLHKCTICGANFQRPSSLSNHMKIHTYIAGQAITSQSTTNFINQTSKSVRKWSDNDNCESQTSIISSSHSSSVQTVQNYDVTQVQWSVPSYTFQNDHTNATVVSNDEKMDSTLQGFAVMSNGEVTQFEYTQQNDVDNQNLSQDYDLSIAHFDGSDELVKAEIIPCTQKELKSHTCDESVINFSRIAPLSTQENVNTSKIWSMPIECEYCDKQFQDANHLASHQTTCAKKLMQDNAEHGLINNKWGKHSCVDCGKKFTTKQKMFRHQWIHRKKTHSCEVCGTQFEKQNQLDNHRLSAHPGDSPFTCNECGKSFVSRQGLWEHGRTHAGSPAHFHCDTCSKTFSSRQGYLIHHRTHTGERPYGCKFCWKAFRDGGTLRKHERIHTGERPHVCPLCSRAFNQKVVLREHVRWVHAASKNDSDAAGPPYACPLCGSLNQDRDELCAHIVKHSDKMIAEAKAKINITPKTKSTKSKKVKNTLGSNQDQAKLDIRNVKDNSLLTVDSRDNNLEGHIINTKQGETLLLVTTDRHSIVSTSDSEQNNDHNFQCHETESLNLITIGKRDDTTILLPSDEQTIIHAITNRNHDMSTLFIPTSDQTEAVQLITATSGKQNNTLHLITKQNESSISEHKNSVKNINLSNTIELIDNQHINTMNIITENVPKQDENDQQKNFNLSETVQVNHYHQSSDIDEDDDNINDNGNVDDGDDNNDKIEENVDQEDNNYNNHNDYNDDNEDDDDEQLICGICGDDFNDKSILMEHVKIHI